MAVTNNIVQNDNGVVLYFNISDTDGNIDILNDIDRVECKISLGATSVTKQCNIVDIATGKCSVTLESSDIATVGRYNFQLTLYYLTGNIYSTEISKFNVSAKL